MYPLLLCLLAAKSDSLTEQGTSELRLESRLWWSPVESTIDVNGFTIVEGDILMPDPENNNLKNAIKSKKYLWENCVIPYELGDDFDDDEKSQILEAMRVIESETCITYVEKKDEKTFIRFQKERNGCYAHVGRLNGIEGPLPINLQLRIFIQSPECMRLGIIEHELLHVAGLFHEQSRPDRDDFVNIHWCNIEANKESNFRKGTEEEMTTFDVPYDYASIMHYPRRAFSRNGKPTITAKEDPEMTLGQRERPSAGDFEKVRKMYNCRGDVTCSEAMSAASTIICCCCEEPEHHVNNVFTFKTFKECVHVKDIQEKAMTHCMRQKKQTTITY